MPWRTPPPACALPRPAGTRWPRNASPRGSTGGSTSASRSITTPKPRASLLRRNARLPGAGSLPNCASRGGLPNELAARLPGRAQATRGVLRPPSRAEPRRAGQDARRAGPRVARPAARPDGPRRHPPRPGPAPRPARRHDRAGRQRPPARAGRPQPGLYLADRPRLPRHDHPAGHPAQRAGGPRLVHRLHALPAGDRAGPAGGAAELPDHGGRPHRHGAGQRLPARRGQRRGRGDGDEPAARRPRARWPARGRRLLRRRRLPPADHRGAAGPGRAARRSRGRRRPAGRPRPGRPAGSRRAAAVPGIGRGRARPAPGDRARSRRRGTGDGRRRPARAGAAGPARQAGRRRRGRVVAALRRADVGRPALRLALQTREQHIRRERATSNICTAQVLLAVVAGMYAVWHGPDGLRAIAERVHRLTSILAAGLRQGVGNKVEVANGTWFDTLTVRVPGRAAAVAAAARERRINLREVDADTFGVSLDETTTTATVEAVWAAFGVTAGGQGDSGDGGASVAALDADPALPEGIPAALRRAGEILAHPVFHSYHSETELLRYLRRLADKDVALDRSMIPLGSCTMKLNATSEMAPISWPEVANMHP